MTLVKLLKGRTVELGKWFNVGIVRTPAKPTP